MAETDVPTLHDPAPEGRGSGGSVGVEIVRLARGSIEHGLVHRKPLPINHGELPRALADPAATFTTLHVEGQLRGCCGTLEAERPMFEASLLAFARRNPYYEQVRWIDQSTNYQRRSDPAYVLAAIETHIG